MDTKIFLQFLDNPTANSNSFLIFGYFLQAFLILLAHFPFAKYVFLSTKNFNIVLTDNGSQKLKILENVL